MRQKDVKVLVKKETNLVTTVAVTISILAILTAITGLGLGFSGGVIMGKAAKDLGTVKLQKQPSTVLSKRLVSRECTGAADDIITTVAGNGTIDHSIDGGVATAVSIPYPFSIALDHDNNFYVQQVHNNYIRKINASTGIITTVAGNGTMGYSGDGGPAIEASFGGQPRLAVDSGNNLYISDNSNQRIRKVNMLTGIITTITGNGIAGYSGDSGLAVAAKLNYPEGVDIDNESNIYIADNANHRIRKVNASTGIITTIAGTGIAGYSGDGGSAIAAKLWNPGGVNVDNNGNIYIIDTNNQRIRKIDALTGIITTIAGTGVVGYSGDGGPAINASFNNLTDIGIDNNNNIYIVDNGNSRIRKISCASCSTNRPPSITNVTYNSNMRTSRTSLSFVYNDPEGFGGTVRLIRYPNEISPCSDIERDKIFDYTITANEGETVVNLNTLFSSPFNPGEMFFYRLIATDNCGNTSVCGAAGTEGSFSFTR